MSSSDDYEKQAYDYIKWVPAVGFAYSVPRMVVYAAKGNGEETYRGAVGALGNLGVTAGTLAVAAAAPAAALGGAAVFTGFAGSVSSGAIGGGAKYGTKVLEDQYPKHHCKPRSKK